MEYETLADELLSAVDTGLKHARAVDDEAEFEIYLFYEHGTHAAISQGMVEASDGTVEGNAIRVAKDNCVSFASSSGVSADRIKRSIHEALASLQSVPLKDKRFKGFCEPHKAGREGTFTDEILNLGKEELIDYANDMVAEGQKHDKRIQTVSSDCSTEWGGFAVGNTRGLQQASRLALNRCSVYCLAVTGEERRPAYEYDVSRERTIRPAGLGAKAAQKAISLLGAKKLGKTAVMPTIWTPEPAAAYIFTSLGQSARGEHIVEGRSPIANKVGEEIADQKLTIVDDGQNPSGVNTDAIDAEGYPQQKNILIQNGKLRQFLFDTYYARIYGAESTGNCSRPHRPFGSALPYELSPLIRPKNMEVKPGSQDLDHIIASIDRQAILIVEEPIGIFHSDVSTGEFSAVAQSAYLIENGEKKGSLQPLSVAGNFYTGLQNLIDVGSDLKKTPYTVDIPSLAFDGFSVVG